LEDLGGTDEADLYICKGGPMKKRFYKKNSQCRKFEFSLRLLFWFWFLTTQFLTPKHWLSLSPSSADFGLSTEKLRRTVL
jgi:hypothetical protein